MIDKLMEMRFEDPAPISVPVTIGKDEFVLFEASAGAAKKFRNAAAKSARLQNGKVVGVDAVADAELILVQSCLFRRTANGNAPVPMETVEGWKGFIVKELFDRVKAVSPGLVEANTPETIRKQIAELQEELALLEQDLPKGSSTSTETASG